jgi:hypothetical protein
MAEEKEKKIKDIFEMGGETASFFERVAKEAGYEGYGRTAEVKESELKSLFSKIKEKLKGKAKEIKEKPQVPLILRILLPFLIVFQAFFPGMIFGMTITFVIILIVIIIVIALIAYFTGGTALAGTSGLIMNIIIPIATITILFVIVNFIGSPNYSKVAGKIPNGSLIVNILLLISSGFAGLTAWKGKSYTSFIAGSGGLMAFLFFIIPFGISYGKPYSICMNLPFISQYCNPREVRVQGPEIVTIPVSGGVSLTYGAPEIERPSATLYAGEPYEYTFTFTNHYSVPITFKLNMSIVSRYATGVKFNIPFNQRISELKANEFYQDGVFIDPAQLTAEEVYGCPYYVWQINATQKIPAEKIECAKDKPCNITGKSCVKTDYMECKCVGWNETTCSGAALYLQTDVEHTGYFVGLANLYYSSINEPPKPAYRLTQGPLSVTVEFQPNPYIGPVHYYRNDTSLYVTFKNMGGDITITSFNVTPLVTNITTIDKEKGMMLEEIVGVDKKWCREEEIVGRFIPNKREFSLMLCKLTPPYVNTTLIDLRENRTIEINNVTFDRILYYCNKIRAPQNYWNVIDWYKEGDVIEVPGNFTIRIGRISIEEVTNSVPTKWSVEINVTLPSGASILKNYTSNEQFKEEGLRFIVEAFLERPTILGTRERLVQLNITANISTEVSGYTFWSSYWENIYKGIDESGLCELLKKGNESESKIVSNALKYTQVKIEFTYVRKTTFESGKIVPYTRTEECMALANETST